MFIKGLVVYGPFNYNGAYTSDSNRDFDVWLKIRDPLSAIRDFEAVDALAREFARVDVHVVSNIDGVALEAAFARCDPATTLIAVASKTFTTIETMTNAASALQWLRDNGVADPHGRVIALTAYPEKAVEWGVDETRVLPFAESVGGRYSLWSSIGFPIALAVGWEEFTQFLGTQVGLMKSATVREKAFARVKGLRPNLPPVEVELQISVSPRTTIFNLKAIGAEAEYTRAYLDACMDEYIILKKDMRSSTSDRRREMAGQKYHCTRW